MFDLRIGLLGVEVYSQRGLKLGRIVLSTRDDLLYRLSNRGDGWQFIVILFAFFLRRLLWEVAVDVGFDVGVFDDIRGFAVGAARAWWLGSRMTTRWEKHCGHSRMVMSCGCSVRLRPKTRRTAPAT